MLFCNQGCLIELRKILWTLLLYARVPVTWGPLSGVERRAGMLSINLLGGKIWFKNPHRTSYIVYFYFSLAGEAVALLGFEHCMAHTFVLADYVSSLLRFVSCIWGIWCIAQFSLQGAFFNVNLEMNRQPTQWTPGAVFRFKCFPRAFSQSHLLRSGICAGFLFTEWHRPKQTKDVIDITGKWKPEKKTRWSDGRWVARPLLIGIWWVPWVRPEKADDSGSYLPGPDSANGYVRGKAVWSNYPSNMTAKLVLPLLL